VTFLFSALWAKEFGFIRFRSDSIFEIYFKLNWYGQGFLVSSGNWGISRDAAVGIVEVKYNFDDEAYNVCEFNKSEKEKEKEKAKEKEKEKEKEENEKKTSQIQLVLSSSLSSLQVTKYSFDKYAPTVLQLILPKVTAVVQNKDAEGKERENDKGKPPSGSLHFGTIGPDRDMNKPKAWLVIDSGFDKERKWKLENWNPRRIVEQNFHIEDLAKYENTTQLRRCGVPSVEGVGEGGVEEGEGGNPCCSKFVGEIMEDIWTTQKFSERLSCEVKSDLIHEVAVDCMREAMTDNEIRIALVTRLMAM